MCGDERFKLVQVGILVPLLELAQFINFETAYTDL